jgi:putative tricarboxylic transport membrane protein
VNSTIILGIATILFALVFRAQAADFPDVVQRMPVLLYWIVLGLAVLMIIEELLKRRSARRADPDAPVAQDDILPAINWPVVLMFSTAIIAYVVLIPIVGYLIMTPVFIAGTIVVSRTMSPSRAVLMGVVATAFVWLVFIWALKLPVPILPFLK